MIESLGESGDLEVWDSAEDTMIGGHAEKGSIVGDTVAYNSSTLVLTNKSVAFRWIWTNESAPLYLGDQDDHIYRPDS